MNKKSNLEKKNDKLLKRIAYLEQTLKTIQTRLQGHVDECCLVQIDVDQLRSLLISIIHPTRVSEANELLKDLSSWLDASHFTEERELLNRVWEPEEEES